MNDTLLVLAETLENYKKEILSLKDNLAKTITIKDKEELQLQINDAYKSIERLVLDAVSKIELPTIDTDTISEKAYKTAKLTAAEYVEKMRQDVYDSLKNDIAVIPKPKDGVTPKIDYDLLKDELKIIFEARKPELKGDKGESIKGDTGQSIKGENGTGITDITTKNNTLVFTLSDGTQKKVKLPVTYHGGGITMPQGKQNDTLYYNVNQWVSTDRIQVDDANNKVSFKGDIYFNKEPNDNYALSLVYWDVVNEQYMSMSVADNQFNFFDVNGDFAGIACGILGCTQLYSNQSNLGSTSCTDLTSTNDITIPTNNIQTVSNSTTRFTLANNTAHSYNFGSHVIGKYSLITSNYNYNCNGTFSANPTGTTSISSDNQGIAAITGSGTLTGTSGANGDITVRMQSAGVFYIENRTGATLDILINFHTVIRIA